MELRYGDREGHPADRVQRQQIALGRGHDRIAYTDTVCYGRRITVATYGPGTAGAHKPAGKFQTLAEIARHGAGRNSYRRRWEWATLEAARAGHLRIVGWLTGVAAWLAGATDQIPSPPQLSGNSRQPRAADASPQCTPGQARHRP